MSGIDSGAEKKYSKINEYQLYTIIYREYAKCKSILHLEIFEAMEISTKRGKFASNWQTTEI